MPAPNEVAHVAGLTVIEVAQWQGSSSPAALSLVNGARALAGLLPPGPRVCAHVTTAVGATAGGVKNADVLGRNLAAVRTALSGLGARTVVVAGGDCGVEIAPIERAIGRHGGRLAVVWLDAHGDLHTPASSPSGAFHGMVLRALLGDGLGLVSPVRTLIPAQIVLAGVRALEPAEREFVHRHQVRLIGPVQLATPAALVETVAALEPEAVYIHVDLDVLDPAEFGAVGFPEPGGLTTGQLTAAVRALAGRFAIAGIGITEYQPGGPADEATLAPLAFDLGTAISAAPL